MSSVNRGFTLLELMIVVAVIAIIGAIAFPSYQNYVIRGNRTLAKTTLNEIAAKQESFFTDRKQYSLTLQGLGYPGNPGAPFYIGKSGKPEASDTGALYSIQLAGASAMAYGIVATPMGQQLKDDCGQMMLASNGQKGSGSGEPECWTR